MNPNDHRKMTLEEMHAIRRSRLRDNGKPRRKTPKFLEGQIPHMLPRGEGPVLPPSDPSAVARVLAVTPHETRAERRAREALRRGS